MGSGASSEHPYADEAAALADGKTQDEIDAYKAKLTSEDPAAYLGWRKAAVAEAPAPPSEEPIDADALAKESSEMMAVSDHLPYRSH